MLFRFCGAGKVLLILIKLNRLWVNPTWTHFSLVGFFILGFKILQQNTKFGWSTSSEQLVSQGTCKADMHWESDVSLTGCPQMTYALLSLSESIPHYHVLPGHADLYPIAYSVT